MRHLIALVAASAFLLQSDIVPAQVGQFPFVLTREEQVLGVVQAGVASFKGIPYASAPVGSLRWRPPQPAPESSTICTAYEYGPACQQPSMPGLGSYGTSEDCLTLNVFRPFEIEDPLPVMMWIHGGSFVAGTAGDPLFDGSKLAQAGVIVITLNYRLGAFDLAVPERMHPLDDREPRKATKRRLHHRRRSGSCRPAAQQSFVARSPIDRQCGRSGRHVEASNKGVQDVIGRTSHRGHETVGAVSKLGGLRPARKRPGTRTQNSLRRSLP